jgi:DNA-binding CsgD family transcriptional regulator
MLAILAIVVSSAGYYLFVFRRRQGSEALMKKGVALHSLSKRENEIIRCLLAGESYKTISEKLFISPATVQSHIKNIYRKLDIHSKYELFNTMRKEDEVSGDSRKLE